MFRGVNLRKAAIEGVEHDDLADMANWGYQPFIMHGEVEVMALAWNQPDLGQSEPIMSRRQVREHLGNGAFKAPANGTEFDFYVARLGKSATPKIVLVNPDLHDLIDLPYKPHKMGPAELRWFFEFMDFIAGQGEFQ